MIVATIGRRNPNARKNYLCPSMFICGLIFLVMSTIMKQSPLRRILWALVLCIFAAPYAVNAEDPGKALNLKKPEIVDRTPWHPLCLAVWQGTVVYSGYTWPGETEIRFYRPDGSIEREILDPNHHFESVYKMETSANQKTLWLTTERPAKHFRRRQNNTWENTLYNQGWGLECKRVGEDLYLAMCDESGGQVYCNDLPVGQKIDNRLIWAVEPAFGTLFVTTAPTNDYHGRFAGQLRRLNGDNWETVALPKPWRGDHALKYFGEALYVADTSDDLCFRTLDGKRFEPVRFVRNRDGATTTGLHSGAGDAITHHGTGVEEFFTAAGRLFATSAGSTGIALYQLDPTDGHFHECYRSDRWRRATAGIHDAKRGFIYLAVAEEWESPGALLRFPIETSTIALDDRHPEELNRTK